ncbi:MAG: RDD family protein [Synergistaceae bacterium]|jgi:uncharacterized RDD family membrane protein YckC|nr:RDD family protein [Synergistaceae bacterium]
MKEWYCAIGGQALGPFPEERLRKMVANGELTPDTFVWSSAAENSGKDWVKAAETELVVIFADVLSSSIDSGRFDPVPSESHWGAYSQRPQSLGSHGSFASARSPAAPLSADVAYMLASPMQRLYAYTVNDLVFLVVIAAAGGLLYKSGAGEKMMVAGLLATALVLFAVNVYLLYRSGQSIGKLVVGIRIADLDGGKAALWRILLLRGLLFFLLLNIPFVNALIFIADIIFLVREDKRMLHDLIAGTIVLNV